MKDSIRRRLDRTVERFEEVAALLADPEVIAQQGRFRELSMEYARIEPVAERFREFRRLEDELRATEELARGPDAGVRELADEIIAADPILVRTEHQRLRERVISRYPRAVEFFRTG